MNENPDIIIGESQRWGEPAPFGLSIEDHRHPVYTIGKTGAGKSTLLFNLILQHIWLGHGVGLIDPHGDLCDKLLQHIPPSRADDLVYFNPGDLEFPIGLNVIGDVPIDDRPRLASGVVEAFKSIWRDFFGPRMENILYNAIVALADCPNTTLLGVNRLLTDATYREWVIRHIRDPFIRHFWADEYAGWDTRYQREAIAPIQNKVGQFLLNPVIRNILGQVKSKISVPFIMDNQRLFIANLAKGKLGHDKSNLLGSLLTTQFQLAAMARTDQPESDRTPFFLFIDEFQNFSTDAFAAILSEARKYRFCLTLSHQYIDQLSLPVRQAVFGNVGTLITFRVGNSDAEVLQKEFSNSFLAQQLVDLDRYEIIVKLLENGANREPFRARTLAALEYRATDPQKFVACSRRHFATARAIVEGKINRWMNSSNKGATVTPTFRRKRFRS